jgi:hypothetical protein
MSHRMTVTVRPLCYFDGRRHPLPDWLNDRKCADGSVDILVDQPPATELVTGELVERSEDGRIAAAGRVLVVGMPERP